MKYAMIVGIVIGSLFCSGCTVVRLVYDEADANATCLYVAGKTCSSLEKEQEQQIVKQQRECEMRGWQWDDISCIAPTPCQPQVILDFSKAQPLIMKRRQKHLHNHNKVDPMTNFCNSPGIHCGAKQ